MHLKENGDKKAKKRFKKAKKRAMSQAEGRMKSGESKKNLLTIENDVAERGVVPVNQSIDEVR
jgi:hypothetical protein